MSFLAEPGLVRKFVEALNANRAFNTQAAVFDGSIQLEVDDDCLWLKVYKGKVIDHQDTPSPFGYTFKLSGPESSWRKLWPLFSYHKGKMGFRYLRQYIELGHEVMNAPLSAVEVEALDLFDAIAAEDGMALDMMLEPGDLQWANNYTILHSRTRFEDADDPALRRKMLRLWLKMPNARELAPDFPGRNGFPAPGDTIQS